MDEGVKGAWAQVENQLQRRNDLIPNLIKTVKGYAAHEKEIFISVADARAKLAGRIELGSGIETRIQAANELGSALSRLLAIAENYPDLKANQNFIRFQDELAGTENRIAVEEPYVPLRFLVCFSSLYGGHICKNHRTYFYEERELFLLLESEPLLKFGGDRLSQRDPAFAL